MGVFFCLCALGLVWIATTKGKCRLNPFRSHSLAERGDAYK
jgi:hypothetical protein